MRRVFFQSRISLIVLATLTFALSGCLHGTDTGGGGGTAAMTGYLLPGTTFLWVRGTSGNSFPDSMMISDVGIVARGKSNCFAIAQYDGPYTYSKTYYHPEPNGDLSEFQENPLMWVTYPFGSRQSLERTWDTTVLYKGEYVSEHVTQTTDFRGASWIATDSGALPVNIVRTLLHFTVISASMPGDGWDTVYRSYSPQLGIIVATEEGYEANYIEKGQREHEVEHESGRLIHYSLPR